MDDLDATLQDDVLVPVVGTIDYSDPSLNPSTSLAGLALPDVDPVQCKLLGGYALAIQALMGVLVLGSLVIKRARETPKRPWKVWLGDVSKQVIGQATVHALNVLISDRIAEHKSQSACTLYFLNVLIDTTLGVALLYYLLSTLTTYLTLHHSFTHLTSGDYGHPPSLYPWSAQLVVYLAALVGMKLVVVFSFWAFPALFDLGDWMLSWLGEEPERQTLFVMMVFPLVMNVVQFILIDSLIRYKPFLSTSSDPSSPSSRHHSHSHSQPHHRDRFLDDPLLAEHDLPSDSESDSSSPHNNDNNRRRRSSDLEEGSRPPSYKSRVGSVRRMVPELTVTSPGEHSYPPSALHPPSGEGEGKRTEEQQTVDAEGWDAWDEDFDDPEPVEPEPEPGHDAGARAARGSVQGDDLPDAVREKMLAKAGGAGAGGWRSRSPGIGV